MSSVDYTPGDMTAYMCSYSKLMLHLLLSCTSREHCSLALTCQVVIALNDVICAACALCDPRSCVWGI